MSDVKPVRKVGSNFARRTTLNCHQKAALLAMEEKTTLNNLVAKNTLNNLVAESIRERIFRASGNQH